MMQLSDCILCIKAKCPFSAPAGSGAEKETERVGEENRG